MDKTILTKLVIKEAKALKKNATKAERSRLNFASLNPEQSYFCIYGQLTGDCWSIRATKLIRECAERVYVQHGSDPLDECELNGKPTPTTDREYFSPIECFIYFKKNKRNGNNKNLIDYLSGKSKKLIINKF